MNIYESACNDLSRLGGSRKVQETAKAILAVLSAEGINKSDAQHAIALVANAVEHADTVNAAGDSTWEPVLLGTNTRIGDHVRVRTNAFGNGELAKSHNGRQGKVTGIRNGQLTVKYEDGGTFQHVAELLERRVG